MIRVAVALVVLGGVAAADKIEDPKPSPPDPTAEQTASEANLVSNVHHDKLTVSGALGGGFLLGDGVGRGPAGTLRIGFRHREVMETLEVTVGSMLHQPPNLDVLHNDDVSVMGGLQYYTTPSLWIRGAAGVAAYTVQSETMRDHPLSNTHTGVASLFGIGVDVVRLHHFVLDIETFTMVSIVGVKGLMATSGLCLGASFY